MALARYADRVALRPVVALTLPEAGRARRGRTKHRRPLAGPFFERDTGFEPAPNARKRCKTWVDCDRAHVDTRRCDRLDYAE